MVDFVDVFVAVVAVTVLATAILAPVVCYFILRKRKQEVVPEFYTVDDLERLVVASNPANFEDMPVSTATGQDIWDRYRRYRDLLEWARQGERIPRSLFERSRAWERYVLDKELVSGGGMHN